MWDWRQPEVLCFCLPPSLTAVEDRTEALPFTAGRPSLAPTCRGVVEGGRGLES